MATVSQQAVATTVENFYSDVNAMVLLMVNICFVVFLEQ